MTTTTIIVLLLIINLALLIYLSFIKTFKNNIGPNELNDHSRKLQPVEGLISLERAVNLIDNYETRRRLHKDLLPDDSERQFGDTHSVYEDIDQVRAYLSYIDRTSREKGIKVRGIRYYFGAYPLSDNTDKAGYQTLVMFPTVHDQKTGIDHRAIDLERSTSQEDVFYIHSALSYSEKKNKNANLKSVQKSAINSDGLSGQSSGKNDMGSSPPRRPKNS